jgi:hypothetical protein
MFNNIDKYLETADASFLGCSEERYGGGARAIIANLHWVQFIFECLHGDSFEYTEVQAFLTINPLFPACWGHNASDALTLLDKKISLLYEFEPSKAIGKWKAKPQFEMKAMYDHEDGEPPEFYAVRWDDIVEDLYHAHRANKGIFFLDKAMKEAGPLKYRNLHAFLNAKVSHDLKTKLEQLET